MYEFWVLSHLICLPHPFLQGFENLLLLWLLLAVSILPILHYFFNDYSTFFLVHSHEVPFTYSKVYSIFFWQNYAEGLLSYNTLDFPIFCRFRSIHKRYRKVLIRENYQWRRTGVRRTGVRREAIQRKTHD